MNILKGSFLEPSTLTPVSKRRAAIYYRFAAGFPVFLRLKTFLILTNVLSFCIEFLLNFRLFTMKLLRAINYSLYTKLFLMSVPRLFFAEDLVISWIYKLVSLTILSLLHIS